MKQYYENVFVVLVYRNATDLVEFLQRTKQKVKDYKVVVVDSFYDKKTSDEIKKIADIYDCDFLSVENKGYSYGNNQGIKYASQKYTFSFLVISNPDILIESYDSSKLIKDGITAPKIINAGGKHQNPMKPYHSRLSDKMCYIGFTKSNKVALLVGRGINKIYRWVWLFIYELNKNYRKIYEAHGCFIIISKNALEKLEMCPFDENMFLFSEEEVLAYETKKKNIRIEYNEGVSVFHKEDGSMKLGNISQTSENYKSYTYYYENYVLKKMQN